MKTRNLIFKEIFEVNYFLEKYQCYVWEEIISIAKSRDVTVFCNALINKILLNTKFYLWNIEIYPAQLCKVNIDNELYQDCMG